MLVLWIYQLSHPFSTSTFWQKKSLQLCTFSCSPKRLTLLNFVKICPSCSEEKLQQSICLISHLRLNIISFCWSSAWICLSNQFLGCVIPKSEHREELHSEYSDLPWFQPLLGCNRHGCNTPSCEFTGSGTENTESKGLSLPSLHIFAFSFSMAQAVEGPVCRKTWSSVLHGSCMDVITTQLCLSRGKG